MAHPHLIRICHACEYGNADNKCAGPCPCRIDGRQLHDHATKGDCPKGKYDGVTPDSPPTPHSEVREIIDMPEELWGDRVKSFIEKWGLDKLVSSSEVPCQSCEERRELLNRFHRFVKKLAGN